MTLFYTQTPSIRPYDRTCTESLNNIHPRSSPTLPEKSSTEAFPQAYSATSPPSKHNDQVYNLPCIVAPCPKKALYAYPGNLFDNFMSVTPLPENPWGLSAVQEDIEDDPASFDTTVDSPETMSDEALACAELKEIMGNSSRGSSRSVSQSTSPDHAHRAQSSPVTEISQDDDEFFGENEQSYAGAIDIEQTRQRPTSRPMKLAIDNSHLIFGSSPITRAHNPLPMDSHFSPNKRHHHQSQPYPSRPALHQATNIQRKLADAVADMQVNRNSFDDLTQPPLSKVSKAAILLRISEGGRRRALSVGSAGLKPGSKIVGCV
ncbi:16572_t:CDS:2 [Acaulospora colombiana]|uniref:16572_t:CDS:1 n=1 Tax=Acaulospora colombiana TaxID=27376 RepID=A0ACA9MNX3_9GLOM|nr:16572_t:CDS:2 [Acaulospora colombiana]